MPGYDEKSAELLENSLAKLPPITKMITDGMTAEDIFFAVTQDIDMMMENKTVTPSYYCPCSKERMEKALISLGYDELNGIIQQDGHAELCCQFCSNKYDFSEEELKNILNNLKK